MGRKKLDIEYIRKQFKMAGYKLLSTEYVNSYTKLEYRCPNGHYGSITWNHFKQGSRCSECVGLKKKTIDFIREQFAKEGYELLSTKYVNNHIKLEYICPKGHRGSISWNCWQRGHRCFECYGNKKLDINFIREQLAKKDYILLTKKYINAHQKLEYICPNGHHNNITWGHFQQGERCPECSHRKKLTIEFIKSEFAKEGYWLLTKIYINAQQKLEYRCPKGHYGSITWGSWQQGNRCPKCFFENNRGPNHPNFNPNLTDEDRQDRYYIPGYREWLYNVKKRDNFTCQVCGKKGCKLNAHHFFSFADNPALRTALDNGICICETCHKLFHHMFGYGNNTREQFEEFKKILAAEKGRNF